MLPCRYSDSYRLSRSSYGRQKLERFIWEEDALPSSHASVIFHTNPYIFPSFQPTVKFFPCTLQFRKFPSLLILSSHILPLIIIRIRLIFVALDYGKFHRRVNTSRLYAKVLNSPPRPRILVITSRPLVVFV